MICVLKAVGNNSFLHDILNVAVCYLKNLYIELYSVAIHAYVSIEVITHKLMVANKEFVKDMKPFVFLDVKIIQRDLEVLGYLLATLKKVFRYKVSSGCITTGHLRSRDMGDFDKEGVLLCIRMLQRQLHWLCQF